MPRIYADDNPEHTIDWAHIAFKHGAAAVDADDDVGYFEDSDAYTVDASKNHLEVWDDMTIAELDALYAYLGGTVDADDTRYEKVRKIETSFSGKYLAALTVASAAATSGTGKTKITITSPGDYDYYFKSAASAAPAPLYGDEVDSTWQKLTLSTGVADEVSPNAATDTKCAVARVSADGIVIGLGSDDLTVKT